MGCDIPGMIQVSPQFNLLLNVAVSPRSRRLPAKVDFSREQPGRDFDLLVVEGRNVFRERVVHSQWESGFYKLLTRGSAQGGLCWVDFF